MLLLFPYLPLAQSILFSKKMNDAQTHLGTVHDRLCPKCAEQNTKSIMGSPKISLGISRQILDWKMDRQGKKNGALLFALPAIRTDPYICLHCNGSACQALIKMQKRLWNSDATCESWENHTRQLFMGAQFHPKLLTNHLFVVFAWKIFSMFATSINGWFSNQLSQCNGKSLFI